MKTEFPRCGIFPPSGMHRGSGIFRNGGYPKWRVVFEKGGFNPSTNYESVRRLQKIQPTVIFENQ